MLPISVSRKTILLEILFLTGLFYLFGGWPVPDVNEQYYIGKAIHFWNRDWLPNDSFLDTPDSHWFFYGSFGFFSLFLSPVALTWFGRWLIWLLTAWSWRKLSFALIPKPGFSILTVAAFLFLIDSFHLAGEWIIGGVEGKGFAFPFVFLGLEAFFRNRSNLCWIYWGIASAFHVLVGGWTVLAALLVWIIQAMNSPRMFGRRLLNILPGLLIGGGISLLGLIPALLLDMDASAETMREAHRIYVFERLSHHLVPSSLPWIFLTRFLLLVLVFGILVIYQRLFSKKYVLYGFASELFQQRLKTLNQDKTQTIGFRFYAFVLVAISIAGMGLIIDFFVENRNISAELLRFYWFRLSDWVVPFGIVFCCFSLFIRMIESFVYFRSTFLFNPADHPIQIGAFDDHLQIAGDNSQDNSKKNDLNQFISNEKEFVQKLKNAATNNRNVICSKQTLFDLNGLINSVLFWLINLTIVFMAIKHIWGAYSQKQAANLSEGGIWLLQPKPVDGIAFLSTINLVFGLILVVYFILLIGKFIRFRFLSSFCFALSRLQKSKVDKFELSLKSENILKRQNHSHFFYFMTKQCQIGLLLLLTILGVFAPIYYSIEMLQTRTSTTIPRSNPLKESISDGWFDVCHWAQQKTDANAVFLVPRSCESFKWNANRAEIGNWKEIPQDASSIVQWFRRMKLFYTIPGGQESTRWNQPLIVVLIAKGMPRVQKECEKYKIDYIIAETPPYALASHEKAMKRYQAFSDYKVYQNDQVIVYDMRKKISHTETGMGNSLRPQ